MRKLLYDSPIIKIDLQTQGIKITRVKVAKYMRNVGFAANWEESLAQQQIQNIPI